MRPFLFSRSVIVSLAMFGGSFAWTQPEFSIENRPKVVVAEFRDAGTGAAGSAAALQSALETEFGKRINLEFVSVSREQARRVYEELERPMPDDAGILRVIGARLGAGQALAVVRGKVSRLDTGAFSIDATITDLVNDIRRSVNVAWTDPAVPQPVAEQVAVKLEHEYLSGHTGRLRVEFKGSSLEGSEFSQGTALPIQYVRLYLRAGRAGREEIRDLRGAAASPVLEDTQRDLVLTRDTEGNMAALLNHLLPGDYGVRVTCLGYQDGQYPAIVRAGETVVVPRTPLYYLQPKPGYLRIHTVCDDKLTPELQALGYLDDGFGSRVFVDGKELEKKAPLTLKLPAGLPYTVEVLRGLYQLSMVEESVTEGSPDDALVRRYRLAPRKIHVLDWERTVGARELEAWWMDTKSLRDRRDWPMESKNPARSGNLNEYLGDNETVANLRGEEIVEKGKFKGYVSHGAREAKGPHLAVGATLYSVQGESLGTLNLHDLAKWGSVAIGAEIIGSPAILDGSVYLSTQGGLWRVGDPQRVPSHIWPPAPTRGSKETKIFSGPAMATCYRSPNFERHSELTAYLESLPTEFGRVLDRLQMAPGADFPSDPAQRLAFRQAGESMLSQDAAVNLARVRQLCPELELARACELLGWKKYPDEEVMTHLRRVSAIEQVTILALITSEGVEVLELEGDHAKSLWVARDGKAYKDIKAPMRSTPVLVGDALVVYAYNEAKNHKLSVFENPQYAQIVEQGKGRVETWLVRLPAQKKRSTPLVVSEDGKSYRIFVIADSFLYAYDTALSREAVGKPVWLGDSAVPPVYSDGLLFCVLPDGENQQIAALEPSDLSSRWTYRYTHPRTVKGKKGKADTVVEEEKPLQVMAPPAVSTEYLVVHALGNKKGVLLVLNKATGNRVNRIVDVAKCNSPLRSPLLHNGAVHLFSDGGVQIFRAPRPASSVIGGSVFALSKDPGLIYFNRGKSDGVQAGMSFVIRTGVSDEVRGSIRLVSPYSCGGYVFDATEYHAVRPEMPVRIGQQPSASR